MSVDPLGEELSAFNLSFTTKGKGRTIPVECAFQASKVFERGGPYPDLLDASPADAKRDTRLRDSGQLVGFSFFGQRWPTEPPTTFYNWVYVNALNQHQELADAVMEFDAFTDIVFNPSKSINCQAEAVAMYVSLRRRHELEEALSSQASFVTRCKVASGEQQNDQRQGSLF